MSKLDDNIKRIIFPQKGKKLFIKDEDFWYDAHIENNWEVYTTGYMEAANLLIFSILESPKRSLAKDL